MNLAEFNLLKVLITESDYLNQMPLPEPTCDPDEFEMPNVRDRIADGANLIDLYMEMRMYHGGIDANEVTLGINEHIFWELAWQALSDSTPKPF